MGADDSQKLLPWRETIFPSRAQTSGSHYEINNVAETAGWNLALSLLLVDQEMASATARLGHFWSAQVGQFCRAPKTDSRNRLAVLCPSAPYPADSPPDHGRQPRVSSHADHAFTGGLALGSAGVRRAGFAPRRSNLFRTSGAGDPVYVLRPRGLDAGRSYRVTFCNREQTAELSGTVLMRDGIAVRLEDELTSEMMLFESSQ